MIQEQEVRLLPWQTKVWDDDSRFKVINCGRRAGKTSLTVYRIAKFAHDNPGSIIWYVAPTYKQAESIMWEMLKAHVPEALVVKLNETKLQMNLSNGTSIHLKGADTPDSLRGVRIDFCIFDEVAFFDRWGEVWKIIRPTLMDSQADCWFISTPNGFNHFKALADRCDKGDGWKYFHFTTYDNLFIPREEIDESKGEMSEDAFAQEMLGDFRKTEGLVYKTFDKEVHVKELEDFQPIGWIRGLDRGFTNPTAVVYVQVDSDGDWYITNEIYQSGLTNTRLSDLLFEMDERLGIQEYLLSTMDSAQAGDIAELTDFGHDFLPVRKESGETSSEYVRYKIQKFSQRLEVQASGRPRVTIHPRCINLIHEAMTYSYPKQKKADDLQPGEMMENAKENPMKANDHALDASADLNVMYMHYFQAEPEKKEWEGKLPGTFIMPFDYEKDLSQGWAGDNKTSWKEI